MSIHYEDFELIINETAGHLTVEARGPGQMTVEPVPLGHELVSALRENEQLAEALKLLQRGYSPSRSQMLVIGRYLWHALMQAPILTAYAQAKGRHSEGTASQSSVRKLRLRLNVRPPTLSRLPWELLFDPTQNSFLAMRRAQPLVRVLDSPNPVGKLRIDGPLSVLLVQAQPINFPPLSLEESEKALQEVFGHRAEIRVLPHATPAKLRLALQKKIFHILHYDGHGFFDEQQQSGFLALENNKKKSAALSGQQLANYLSGTQVRLVVLSACQTAQDSMRQRFVGVAQHLMRSSNLPAVVAMQFAIPDTSAIAFNRGFYGALANGFPVEAALASGRMAIQEVTKANTPDWATPLLMMRTTDGRLWEHFIEHEEITPILTSRNPYVGLQTFQEEDAAWFFGREGLLKLLQQKIEESPFLAILGPSGSGKSSVVLAGLLPALKAGALPNSDKWHYLSIKPTNRPLDTLAAALNKLQGGNLGTLSSLRQALVSNERSLLLAADMVRADKANTRLVLVVDQFEELWTLAPTESDARQTFVIEKQTPFIRLLLSAIEEQTETNDPALLIILTMRIDFLHRAAEIRDLARYIGEHDVIVSPMQAYELHQAIEEPAKKAGGTFEPGLIDELIEQTRGRQGALPLLEYTLQELWRSKQPDGTMTWAAFRKLNGVEGALAARANSIFDQHYNTAEKQEQLRHLLLRLVQPGEGTADTRRRVLLNELVPAGTDLEGVQTLLKPLVDERLLTTTSEQIGTETIEVSHEALINAWPTFKEWIDHAREDLRLQLQLEEAAKEWESHEENNGYLWSGLRLANAETWLNRAQPSLNKRDVRFLEASWAEEQANAEAADKARREREQLMTERAAQQGRATLFRNFLAVVAMLLVLALVLAGFAFNRQQQATNAQSAAQAEITRAVNAESTAQAETTRAVNAESTAQAETNRAVKAESTVRAQAQRSQSLAQAGQSLFELGNQPEEALLLSLAAIRADKSPYEPIISRALYRTFDEALIRGLLKGHQSNVLSVTWRSDGQHALTSSDDGTARIWDVATGEIIQTIKEDECSIRLAIWSLDGQKVLIGGDKGEICIWDVQSKTLIQKEIKADSAISSLAWNPYKPQVAIGSQDGTFRVWDIVSNTDYISIENDGGEILSVAWAPDGEFVAAGDELGRIHFWNVTNNIYIGPLKSHTGQVYSLAWHPNGQQLLTGGADHVGRIWDIATWKELFTLTGHRAEVRSVRWSPDGEQILTGSDDKTARIWDASNGSELRRLEGHKNKVRAVAWSPNHGQLLTASDDQTVRIWDALAGTELHLLAEHKNIILSVAWSPNGEQVLTGSNDGKALIWDLATKTNTRLDQKDIFAVAWHPNEPQVVMAGYDGIVRVWNTESGMKTEEWSNDGHAVYGVAWSPDGRQIIAGGDAKTVRIWDVASGKEPLMLTNPFSPTLSVAWSPNGEQVLIGGNKNVLIQNLSTNEKKHLKHAGWVHGVAWNPINQQLIATGDQDGSVRIWDVITEQQVKRLEGHQADVYSVAWSPTGEELLTGSADQTVRLWNIENQEQTHLFSSYHAAIRSVAWSPGGMQILTGGDDHQARISTVNRDLITADLVRRVCNLFTDDEIKAKISDWEGCESIQDLGENELLTNYDALRKRNNRLDEHPAPSISLLQPSPSPTPNEVTEESISPSPIPTEATQASTAAPAPLPSTPTSESVPPTVPPTSESVPPTVPPTSESVPPTVPPTTQTVIPAHPSVSVPLAYTSTPLTSSTPSTSQMSSAPPPMPTATPTFIPSTNTSIPLLPTPTAPLPPIAPPLTSEPPVSNIVVSSLTPTSTLSVSNNPEAIPTLTSNPLTETLTPKPPAVTLTAEIMPTSSFTAIAKPSLTPVLTVTLTSQIIPTMTLTPEIVPISSFTATPTAEPSLLPVLTVTLTSQIIPTATLTPEITPTSLPTGTASPAEEANQNSSSPPTETTTPDLSTPSPEP